MKIYAILDDNQEVLNGCFYHRVHNPLMELKRRGHEIEYMTLTAIDWDKLKEADIAIFSRTYNNPHFALMWRCRAYGIKIVYELDDDIWNIPRTNIASTAYEANNGRLKKRIEETIEEADLVTTTTEPLKKILSQFHDNVQVIPNALNLDRWQEREGSDELVIGWSGGQNHIEDLGLIVDVIKDLQEKYDFRFVIQGICSKPLEADGYEASVMKSIGTDHEAFELVNNMKLDLYKKLLSLKNFYHIPFYPPDMHSKVVGKADIDIGLIPIIGYKFDESKSILKLLEYTAAGTTAIASDELPYKGIAPYTTSNREKDWYKAIEAMIKDKSLREKTLKKQKELLFPKYDIKTVGDQWEKAFKQL